MRRRRRPAFLFATHVFLAGSTVLAAPLTGSVRAEESRERFMQIAEIEIDPSQLEAYKVAVRIRQEHFVAAGERFKATLSQLRGRRELWVAR